MTITFCGHSKTNDQNRVSKWLDMILPALIEGGADTFYLGGYGDFDRLAAAAVRRQKVTYPHIESVLVLPYLNREFDTTAYDSTTYPPLEKVPPRFAIVKRNQWMVSESDVVISGVIHNWGGAAQTLDFARSKGKIIFQYPRQSEKK
ncbi:MAG: hypothetical protein K2O18_14670 [Oscillospiraceae bacterium]|nr:hypothetical protein [Oscillospiraceae bacterium]